MNRRHPIKQLSEQRRQDSSTPNGVASSQENARRLSGDLALARNCLSNLLFAESALDKELARREARRFLGHPPVEHAHETLSDVPFLQDRATGVHGIYCIARVVNGTSEYWTGKEWAAFCGDMHFDLRGSKKASEPWQNCRMLACQPNRRCMNSEDCQSRRPRSGHT